MTRALARRPLRALLGLALLLSALAPTREATSAALNLPGARVDPALAEALSTGSGTAIFTWDEAAPRSEVEGHLRAAGIPHTLFEAFPVGVACIGPADLGPLRRTPGVPALYADRALAAAPALANSVPQAFNGDPDLWWGQEGITGDGIVLAVMDTGVDGTHPDLEFGRRLKRNLIMLHSHQEYRGPWGANSPPCADFEYPPRDNATGEPLPDPVDSDTESGHGTHIASVAAGDGAASGGVLKGMAPEADVWGYRVIGSVSPTYEVEMSEHESIRPSLVKVLAAMNHFLSVGLFQNQVAAKVALLGFSMEGLLEPWHPFLAAIDGLDASGISLVVPAGNEGGAASSCDAPETCHISYYSGHPWAITVGASDGRTTLASYSSTGDPVDRSGDLWFVPDTPPYRPTLVAPGTGVVAAQRVGLAGLATIEGEHTLSGQGDGRPTKRLGYHSMSGTSVAAGHVAGAIALMQQAAFEAKGCYLTARQVRQILRETATPMPGYDAHEVGAGALDATAAIWAARFAPTEDIYNESICPRPPASS